MKIKKIIISIVAILVILAAVISVWQWQEHAIYQPVRQDREIR